MKSNIREIRLPHPHPEMRPRVEGSPRTAPHPGTAVRIGEDLFEVMTETCSAGREWIYGLEPWKAGNVTRIAVEWGDAAEKDFLAGLRRERIRTRKKNLALGGQALLGFLPRPFQERLAQTLEFDPGRATLYSALLETLAAGPPAFLFFLQIFGTPGGRFGPVIPSGLGFFALAGAIEGIVRLVINLSSGEAVGSLPLSLLGLRFDKGPRDDVMSDEFLPAGDVLEVLSPTPKAWWLKAGGITCGGDSFLLIRSAAEGRRFRYVFRKGGSGFPETDAVLERERNIAADRAYALAPLWGFLPRADQEAAAFYGRTKTRLWVRGSIAFNLLLSFSIVALDMVRIGAGGFAWWTLVRFLSGLALLGESVIRLLRHLQTGDVSGSFLGVLIKPLFSLAVQAGPSGAGKPRPPRPGPESSGR